MTETIRKKPGPKPKALPKVSVIERRLQNPFGTSSIPITLKTAGEHVVRVVNSELRSGRIHEMTHAKGWTFVTPDEIDGTADEYGLEVKNGRLVRGERGQEVLMKMGAEDFAAVQRAKSNRNLSDMGASKTKSLIVKRAEDIGGDEAAEEANRQFRSLEIRDERAPSGEDPVGPDVA